MWISNADIANIFLVMANVDLSKVTKMYLEEIFESGGLDRAKFIGTYG